MPKMWRVFSELLGPQIISLLNVDYCGTSEYFSGRKTKESLLSEQNFDGEANWSGVVSFYCIQMSGLFSAMIEMTRHVHHVFALRQWCYFSQIEALNFMYLYMCMQLIQKQIVKYNMKSKYPEEYLTVDKVGSEKLLTRKSCFL